MSRKVLTILASLALVLTLVVVSASEAIITWTGKPKLDVVEEVADELVVIINEIDEELTSTQVLLATEKDEVSRLEVELAYEQALVASLQGELENANNEIARLMQELVDDGVDYEGVYGLLEEAEERIAELDVLLSSANRTINSLESTITNMQYEIEHLNNTMTVLINQKEALRLELNDANDEIARLEAELNLANTHAENQYNNVCNELKSLPNEYLERFTDVCSLSNYPISNFTINEEDGFGTALSTEVGAFRLMDFGDSGNAEVYLAINGTDDTGLGSKDQKAELRNEVDWQIGEVGNMVNFTYVSETGVLSINVNGQTLNYDGVSGTNLIDAISVYISESDKTDGKVMITEMVINGSLQEDLEYQIIDATKTWTINGDIADENGNVTLEFKMTLEGEQPASDFNIVQVIIGSK
ncbi:hypothetical protein RJG79_12040 [Mycoplasmatota bacterium WC44]